MTDSISVRRGIGLLHPCDGSPARTCAGSLNRWVAGSLGSGPGLVGFMTPMAARLKTTAPNFSFRVRP